MNKVHFPLIPSLLHAENKDGVCFMNGEFLELLINLVLKVLQLGRSGVRSTSLCLEACSLFRSPAWLQNHLCRCQLAMGISVHEEDGVPQGCAACCGVTMASSSKKPKASAQALGHEMGMGEQGSAAGI